MKGDFSNNFASSGTQNMALLKGHFHWVAFRSEIEEMLEPPVVPGNYMELIKIIIREVDNLTVERKLYKLFIKREIQLMSLATSPCPCQGLQHKEKSLRKNIASLYRLVIEVL